MRPHYLTPSQTLAGTALQNLSTTSVADALKYFSGVQIKDYGGLGGLKTVNVRSLGSQHVGVYLDGIRITNAQNGQIDLGRYSLSNMESVALYNANRNERLQSASEYASAATVYLQTRRPDSTALSVEYGTGSFGLQKLKAYLSFKNILFVDAEYQRTDGDYPFCFQSASEDTVGKRRRPMGFYRPPVGPQLLRAVVIPPHMGPLLAEDQPEIRLRLVALSARPVDKRRHDVLRQPLPPAGSLRVCGCGMELELALTDGKHRPALALHPYRRPLGTLCAERCRTLALHADVPRLVASPCVHRACLPQAHLPRTNTKRPLLYARGQRAAAPRVHLAVRPRCRLQGPPSSPRPRRLLQPHRGQDCGYTDEMPVSLVDGQLRLGKVAGPLRYGGIRPHMGQVLSLCLCQLHLPARPRLLRAQRPRVSQHHTLLAAAQRLTHRRPRLRRMEPLHLVALHGRTLRAHLQQSRRPAGRMADRRP